MMITGRTPVNIVIRKTTPPASEYWDEIFGNIRYDDGLKESICSTARCATSEISKGEQYYRVYNKRGELIMITYDGKDFFAAHQTSDNDIVVTTSEFVECPKNIFGNIQILVAVKSGQNGEVTTFSGTPLGPDAILTGNILHWTTPKSVFNDGALTLTSSGESLLTSQENQGNPVVLDGFAIFAQDEESTTPKGYLDVQFVTDHQGGEEFSVAKSEGNKLIRTQGDMYRAVELQESLFNSVAKEHSENIIGGDLQLRELREVFTEEEIFIDGNLKAIEWGERRFIVHGEGEVWQWNGRAFVQTNFEFTENQMKSKAGLRITIQTSLLCLRS